jgi:superfamily I DNA/RNA helicase
MTKQWTHEQFEIFAEARDTNNNLIIEALAGAAKTSTLVELAKVLRGSVLSVAFNKKIATEMADRMPQHVHCRTLNSLGHKIWGDHLRKRLSLSTDKVRYIFNDYINIETPEEEREALYESYSDIMQACRASKNSGHVPDFVSRDLGNKCVPLMDDAMFYASLPEELTPVQQAAVNYVLVNSFADALNGKIDFDDQLLMPTVMRCIFPAYNNVLIDEAQDLSELNHRMLEKLVKGRIIAVGDRFQAIYAFRGAHTNGMTILKDRFKMQSLHLTQTFRCPENVCEHVRAHVPLIRSWDNNPNNPGLVRTVQAWSIDEIPNGSVVLCRNNAPLFNMAIRFIKSGRRPTLWGNDIAATLVKTLESLGPLNMARADALKALTEWAVTKEKKLRSEGGKRALADRVACLRIFIDDAETLQGACKFARDVLNSEGTVDLCTGHKSKGNEWDHVYIIEPHLLSVEDPQDLNLAYVMATRSQNMLTYMNLDGMI